MSSCAPLPPSFRSNAHVGERRGDRADGKGRERVIVAHRQREDLVGYIAYASRSVVATNFEATTSDESVRTLRRRGRLRGIALPERGERSAGRRERDPRRARRDAAADRAREERSGRATGHREAVHAGVGGGSGPVHFSVPEADVTARRDSPLASGGSVEVLVEPTNTSDASSACAVEPARSAVVRIGLEVGSAPGVCHRIRPGVGARSQNPAITRAEACRDRTRRSGTGWCSPCRRRASAGDARSCRTGR